MNEEIEAEMDLVDSVFASCEEVVYPEDDFGEIEVAKERECDRRMRRYASAMKRLERVFKEIVEVRDYLHGEIVGLAGWADEPYGVTIERFGTLADRKMFKMWRKLCAIENIQRGSSRRALLAALRGSPWTKDLRATDLLEDELLREALMAEEAREAEAARREQCTVDEIEDLPF